MKTCSKCGEMKPLEAFTPGLARCKDCRNARNRELYGRDVKTSREQKRAYRYSRPEITRAGNRERNIRWRAQNPEAARQNSTEASRRLRERDPGYFRRYYWANVEKERARQRENMRRWREQHADEERARKQRYRKAHLKEVQQRERENTHRRRALMRNSSPELAEHMARLLQEPCDYCGSLENITIDHIVPLSRGGKHEATNIAPACVHCNCSKGARTLDEWLSTPNAA